MGILLGRLFLSDDTKPGAALFQTTASRISDRDGGQIVIDRILQQTIVDGSATVVRGPFGEYVGFVRKVSTDWIQIESIDDGRSRFINSHLVGIVEVLSEQEACELLYQREDRQSYHSRMIGSCSIREDIEHLDRCLEVQLPRTRRTSFISSKPVPFSKPVKRGLDSAL
jgi:hypothetical protein